MKTNNGLQIAIDGPSGSGKSTIAKALAMQLGYVHIDTGAMYRAVALHAYRAGISWSDEAGVLAILDGINIGIKHTSSGQRIYLGGDDVTDAVRTAEIGVGASVVAPHSGVRAKLVLLQQDLAKNQNVVMDGRDIGTVVLAYAPVKIFLTASLEARVARRLGELSAMSLDFDADEITEQMRQRDYDDENKSKALKRADDAVVLDTSNMNIDEVVAQITKIIESKGAQKNV